MTTKVAISPAFEALLGDLKTMAKAIDVNQERIAAGRSAEGHMQSGDSLAKSEAEKKAAKDKEEKEETERKEREKNAGGKEGKEGKEHMTKSFVIETEGGNKIEVQDATELLKALSDKVDTNATQIFATLEGAAQLLKSQSAMLQTMGEQLVAQKTTIAEQDTLLKALRADVDKVGASPAGRKAVVTLAERQANPATEVMAKGGMPEGVTVDDFFAKAFDMQREGKLTGVDISFAEAALNGGHPVPPAIVQRVLGGSSGRR